MSTFEEAIQPLLDAYAAMEADVTEKEAELAELRDKRNRLKAAARALAPERVPGTPTKRAEKVRYSQTSVEYVAKFLFDNVEGEFGTMDILNYKSYEGVGSATLPAILRDLHAAGNIRLVRKGKGSSRYYEVIR
jgi:hypothetical protein